MQHKECAKLHLPVNTPQSTLVVMYKWQPHLQRCRIFFLTKPEQNENWYEFLSISSLWSGPTKIKLLRVSHTECKACDCHPLKKLEACSVWHWENLFLGNVQISGHFWLLFFFGNVQISQGMEIPISDCPLVLFLLLPQQNSHAETAQPQILFPVHWSCNILCIEKSFFLP